MIFAVRMMIYGIIIGIVIIQASNLYQFFTIYQYAKKYIPKETRKPFIVLGSPFMIVESNERYYNLGNKKIPSKIDFITRTMIMAYIIENIKNGIKKTYLSTPYPRVIEVYGLKGTMNNFLRGNVGRFFRANSITGGYYTGGYYGNDTFFVPHDSHKYFSMFLEELIDVNGFILCGTKFLKY